VALVSQILGWLHIFAAVYWTGSLLFLTLVATPLLTMVRPPSFERQLSRLFWQKAHVSMWIATVVLVVSGANFLREAGRLNASIVDLNFLRSSLGIKLMVVGAMIVLSLLHDQMLGPGARRKDPRDSTDPPGIVGKSVPWFLAAGAVAAFALSVLMRG
jgi:uncharacterized membrane protein